MYLFYMCVYMFIHMCFLASHSSAQDLFLILSSGITTGKKYIWCWRIYPGPAPGRASTLLSVLSVWPFFSTKSVSKKDHWVRKSSSCPDCWANIAWVCSLSHTGAVSLKFSAQFWTRSECLWLKRIVHIWVQRVDGEIYVL